MIRPVNIGRNSAVALVARMIALEYVSMKMVGLSPEIEHFTSWWLRRSISNYDENFENQVMEQVLENIRS